MVPPSPSWAGEVDFYTNPVQIEIKPFSLLVHRYLMATGGLRQKRALNTVEVFDPKRPKVSSVDRFQTAIGNVSFRLAGRS